MSRFFPSSESRTDCPFCERPAPKQGPRGNPTQSGSRHAGTCPRGRGRNRAQAKVPLYVVKRAVSRMGSALRKAFGL